MWLSLVRNTEWSAFLDMVSPSFFEVLPASALRGQAKELISNYVTRPRFIRVREDVEAVVDEARLGITMRGALPKPRELSDDEKRNRAEAVLRLFFHQLFKLDTPLLDLRSRSFAADDRGKLVWNPAPLYLKWEPDFLPHARDLYLGLYGGDEERFGSALDALSLTPAEDILRAHFGCTNGEYRFSLAEFQKSFHQAFVKCRDAGMRLHGNFLPFGLYLACLYEHLETLGVPMDVARILREQTGASAGTAHSVPA